MLNKYKTKREEGFTIIEVLIVLAIAGLIILIVFLAVPALQRNARNNARNQEASRISAAVTECLANHNGQKSACLTNDALGIDMTTDYQQFSDITYQSTGNAVHQGSTTVPIVRFDRKCGTTGDVPNGTNPTTRDFVVMYEREGGGSTTIDRCLGSQ